ncbi:hypothetical protein WKW79_34570 [Variovorax robiniae]|uniref:Uncharacterized protein n=1 Tax=Variovorax robiniae TaxID=1836199 RepID=A0ABU8XJ41_9BURK
MSHAAQARAGESQATLSGAAALRLLVRHASADAQLRRDGCEILYAVDTSVLQLFIAPDKHKPSLFFIGQEPKLAAFMSALSHFIFYTLQDQPLLVIPPHDAEMVEVVQAIAGKADQHALTELPAALAAVAHIDQPAEDVMKVLLEQAPTIVSTLFNIAAPGPMREIERYRALLRSKRLRNVLRDDSLPQPERGDWARIESREADFYFALRDAKRVSSRSRVMRDARVMAYLEWLNDRIAPTRVVHLIAFDEALSLIADREEAHGNSRHFVRDPRYFLSTKRLLESIPAGDLAGWIDEVLLALCPTERVYLDWLVERARIPEDTVAPAEERSAQPLVELSQRLGRYAEEVSLKYGLLDSNIVEGIHSRKPNNEHILSYIRSNHQQLDEILKRRIAETIGDIDRLSVMAGFYLIADGDGDFSKVLEEIAGDIHLSGVARAPAWFRFNDISDWTQKLYSALSSRSGKLRRVAAAFDWPGSNLSKQYELRIVQAYVLSLRNHWDAAQTLCRRAMGIADAQNDKILGHEAAYFRSICLRHLARTPGDVKRAQIELADAERRWEKGHPGVMDPRFAAERLVQRFVVWELSSAHALSGAQGGADADLKELQAIMGEMWGLWPHVWDEAEPGVRQSLAIQLFTNIAEGTAIEQLVLKRSTTVPLEDVVNQLERIRKSFSLTRNDVPIFVRIMIGLVEWMHVSHDVLRRSVVRDDVHKAIEDYARHSLGGYEDGLMKSFVRAIQAPRE